MRLQPHWKKKEPAKSTVHEKEKVNKSLTKGRLLPLVLQRSDFIPLRILSIILRTRKNLLDIKC